MSSHQPTERAVRTDTIMCAETGVLAGAGPEGEDLTCATLADLEAFCADLRRHGAGDDLKVENAHDLSVTLGSA